MKLTDYLLKYITIPTIAFCISATLSPVYAQKQILEGATQRSAPGSSVLFGESLVTKGLASRILDDEGMTYIAHFACRGSRCTSGQNDISRSFEKNNDPTHTILRLTGFNEKKGAVSISIVDQPCSLVSKKSGSISNKTQGGTGRASCFGGYKVLWRTLHDLYVEADEDGWLIYSSDRYQVPNRIGKSNKEVRSMWADVMTVELQREGIGWQKVSDGAWTYELDRILNPDGSTHWEDERNDFTISGSGPGKGVPLPNINYDLPPVERKTTFGADVAISKNSKQGKGDKVAISDLDTQLKYCGDMADSHSTKIASEAKDKLFDSAAWKIVSFIEDVWQSGTIGSGSLPGGNVTVGAADFTGDMENSLENKEEGLRETIFQDCMSGDLPEQPNMNLQQGEGWYLLTIQGANEGKIEVARALFKNAETCRGHTQKKEFVNDNEEQCTEETVVKCDPVTCECEQEVTEVCVSGD